MSYEKKIENLAKKLNDIFNNYFGIYYPNLGHRKKKTKKWGRNYD